MAAKRKKPAYEVWVRVRRDDGQLCVPRRIYRGEYMRTAYWDFGDRCECVPEHEAIILHRDVVTARGGRLQLRDGEKRLEAEDCHE